MRDQQHTEMLRNADRHTYNKLASYTEWVPTDFCRRADRVCKYIAPAWCDVAEHRHNGIDGRWCGE